MAQTIVSGRITADLEMKTSANGNPYVRFDLVENIGSKENSRPQYFQICAWSDDAKRIVKARAKKGSLIWVFGSLELETFTKRDGITTDKRLKLLLDNWGFSAALTNSIPGTSAPCLLESHPVKKATTQIRRVSNTHIDAFYSFL